MFQLSQTPPILLTWVLFAIKLVETVPLLTRGLTLASANRRRCDGILAAYDGRLMGLRRLALFRPRLMIITGLWLSLIFIWFIFIVFSYSYPSLRISQYVAVTYQWAIWISLGTLTFGFLIIVGTLFSFARVYSLFRFILPQPDGRLASRIDRNDEGYFRVDDGEAENIVAYVIRHVLDHPEWYDQAIIFRASGDDGKSARYANFVFLGELIEARATVGGALERWGWITNVYEKSPAFFEPDQLKQLSKTGQFGKSLIAELAKHSEDKEISVPSFNDALNSGVARLGTQFKFDARNIGQMGLLDRLLIKIKLLTRYELIKKRIVELDVFDEAPAEANTVLLIKLMASRGIWEIDWNELEFPFSPWQCVFLLRSGILRTDLKNFSSWDQDFQAFRNDALKSLAKQVKDGLELRSDEDKAKVRKTLNSDITDSSAMMLADTFLWQVGSRCCRYNNCGEIRNERGILCPLSSLHICKVEPGKKLFTFRESEFVLE